MEFVGRDLISINDFTKQEIEEVLDLADIMNERLERGDPIELCKGKDMATLFYEPSTRTRGSFERAMHKLGGRVISFAEAKTTSAAAKGETIADTVRVLESYADIIVIRHPLEGAAKVAADYAHVPVINAGDGAHEHPTQTLCDLYTIRKNKGRIKGLTVCLKGDLKYGRTIHSLIYALARLGAEVFCWPPVPDLDIPEAVLSKLSSKYNYVPMKVSPDDLKHVMGEVDVLYIAPVRPFNYSLWQDSDTTSSVILTFEEVLGKTDVIYVTRLQTERMGMPSDVEAEESGPLVTRELLGKFKKSPLIMHPLPRVNELPSDLDNYPRSVYFQEAAYGVPIRMALTALLLGESPLKFPERDNSLLQKKAYAPCIEAFGIDCSNPDCVSNNEREKRHVTPEFEIIEKKPLMLRCVYCEHQSEHDMQKLYIASSKWHQGILENKRYYSYYSFMLERIKQENLIIFGSKREAMAQGFKPSQYASTQRKVKGGSKR